MNINEQERSRLKDGLFGATDRREEWGRFEQAALELVQRQTTVHERVVCPRCGAQVGEACRRMIGGVGHRAQHNKHPHRQRLRADGLYER